MPVRITEAGGTMTLDRRGTGRFLVQLINAGVGSSAEYTPAALQLAEQQRQFAAGTHMYVDHKPTHQRTGSHGERSLRDLAAVLTSDAHYDDQTQALVAEAQAVGGYADVLEHMRACQRAFCDGHPYSDDVTLLTVGIGAAIG